MRNPFRKTVEIHHKYDILPAFNWAEATSESATEYLKPLTRIQLLELDDRQVLPDDLREEYFEALYEAKGWPMNEEVIKVLNRTLQTWGADKSLECQFDALKRQVEGMQKKLDRALKIIENTEITMSAKTVLSM